MSRVLAYPMGEAIPWVQSPENTLESLRHAIMMFDGIEFDVRITADRQLIVHHDREVSIPKEQLGQPTAWVEEWKHDDLVDLGFLSFSDLLADRTVQRLWAEEGKMGCIEIKRPHPKASSGGGFFGRSQHNQHVADAMKLAEKALDEHGIPQKNTVFYAFHKGMPASASLAKTQRPWAALIPYIPPYGTRNTQRLQALPQYISMPFKRLVNRHRAQGSSMLPCAVEYFQSSTRRLPLGRPVGLHGAGFKRLNRSRNGMPTYVWPTRPDIEHALLHAGMTALTDHADPEMTWLPSGHLRWNRPGTRPLTKDQWACLSVSEDDHLSVLKDLEKDTPTWSECDQPRRRALVQHWKERWNWRPSVESILSDFSEATPPWSAPRIIGHRGSGKTARPVLNPQSM